MITEKIGNLLDAQDVDIVVHQCNLFHTFGGGIAKVIKEKFPKAFEADKETEFGDSKKLGTYSTAEVDSAGTSIRVVINLYSQTGIGGQNRQTSYDAMVSGLTKIKQAVESVDINYTIGIPYQLGCGLANGNWSIVKAIIYSIFEKSPVKVIIYMLPGYAVSNQKT